jgi:hypothetical protein|tara:strand:- start:16192 stop:16788 length:597 start_codon:yes stop_codon:yes gene_type:complete
MEKKKLRNILNKSIVNVPIGKVKPYWRNARNNTDTIKLIKESVTKYGFNGSILVDKAYTIITGHARYSALVQLGYEEVPVEISDLNEKDCKAYRIIDNKIAEKTNWETGELMMEIREIGEIEHMQQFFDVDLDSWLDVSVGVTVNDVTEEDVNKTRHNTDTQFQERVEKMQDSMVKITCPECLEDIEINRKQLEVYLK